VRALRYNVKVNVPYFPDPNHGCHTGSLASLKKVCVYDFWTLLMDHGGHGLAWAFVRRPGGSSCWRACTLDEFFKHQGPRTSPLFQERGHVMADDLLADDMVP
jgi:hypothetical protein